MMKRVYIRPLAPQEAPVLTEFLYHAIFIPEGMEPPPGSIVEKPELQVYVAAFGTHPHDHAFAAEAAGQIVGAVWVRDMQDYGHLEDGVPSFAISVLPEWRNQGIGTALMQRMLSHLAGTGYAKASLSVQKRNPAARLYRRLGFQTVGETGEEYLMVHRLCRHDA
jgi:ribosomal protein S18 acetylase RimI-like enzyme